MTYIIILLYSFIWQPISHIGHTNQDNISVGSNTVPQQKVSFRRPKTLTPVSQEELMTLLKESHITVFGKEPSKYRLAMGWAQVSFENGRGDKIYNFNFGNIGASKKEPHFYISGSRFRANESAEEGAVRYWSHLKERCNSVLGYFNAGDPTGAAYQLRRCGYYRCDREHYARSMRKLFWEGIRLNEK